MSAAFTREEIDALAALAQLELDPSETELFARQLADILEYVRQIQGIDTAGVPPTASVIELEDTDRSDEMQLSLDRSDALMNAPDAAPEAGLFKVPRVIG
jgi:aspartyl-tRNA(Asn)/glutamyl-tRNA(Gln) amidotransferase subunit C